MNDVHDEGVLPVRNMCFCWKVPATLKYYPREESRRKKYSLNLDFPIVEKPNVLECSLKGLYGRKWFRICATAVTEDQIYNHREFAASSRTSFKTRKPFVMAAVSYANYA